MPGTCPCIQTDYNFFDRLARFSLAENRPNEVEERLVAP